MTDYLYITADKIGQETGGGVVSHNESAALKELGSCKVWGREFLQQGHGEDPWLYDNHAERCVYFDENTPKLAHFYAGTFSKTIHKLKQRGVKITYTAAAHSIEVSKQEHESLGLPYNYPHMVNPDLWRRYLAGYLAADILVCPSEHSATVMRSFGFTGRVEVIPHGIHLPDPQTIKPFPKQFVVGYLGAYGPDKGVRYLLEAWKKLNYKDARLILAGRDSTSPYVVELVKRFGGGNIQLMGWVNHVSDFYNNVTLYVQPSASEGFGIEVLEALSYGRPVVCSRGAGACDVLKDSSAGLIVGGRSSEEIAGAVEVYRPKSSVLEFAGKSGLEQSKEYTWDKIKEKYKEVWRSLL